MSHISNAVPLRNIDYDLQVMKILFFFALKIVWLLERAIKRINKLRINLRYSLIPFL